MLIEIVDFLAHLKCAGSMQLFGSPSSINNSLKMNAKETLRNVKLYKQMKKSSSFLADKRKTISDFYTRALTPPASFRKKKVIERRNSWPPISPLKLTKRKKYHESIKVRDFQEPFLMDTFHWLTMKYAPEKFKIAPLAKLSEVDEFESNMEKYPQKHLAQSNSNERVTKNFHMPYFTNKVSFYFVLKGKQKQIIDKRKYLENLKSKCFIKSVPSIKPTNFDSLSNSAKPFSSKVFVDRIEQSCSIQNEILNATVNVDAIQESHGNSLYDITEDNFENQGTFHHESTRPYFTPVNRSIRPLQSYNSVESEGGVLTCSVMPDLDIHYFKQKMFLKDNFKNKENIKINRFPNARYPDNVGKLKNHSHAQFSKKSPKVNANNGIVRNKYRLPDRFIVNESSMIGKELHVIPKTSPSKSNMQDISSFAPQDMMDSNTPESKKNTSESKELTNPSKPSASKSTTSDVVSQSGASSSGNGQSKPYVRQLFEQDIHSNFAKSSKVIKSEKNEKPEIEEEKDKKPKSEKKENDEDDIKKTEIPAAVIGQAFLSTLIEQAKTSSTDSCIPAAVIGQSFLKSLAEQTLVDKEKLITSAVSDKSKSEITKLVPTPDVGQSQSFNESKPDQNVEPKTLPATVVGQVFLKNLIESQSEVDIKTETPNLIPASVLGQSFAKSLLEKGSSIQTIENIPSVKPGSTSVEGSLKVKANVLPASVLGQAFLKTLIQEQTPSELPEANVSQETLPASVVGQTFLKTLLQESQSQQIQEVNQKPIPSSVIGQTFLKTLSEQALEKQDIPKEPTIPSSVVGQAFLKTLLEQTPETTETPKESVVPSSVVGQAFLKTLLEQASKTDAPKEPVVPSSVVGQAFLKTLLQQTSETTETPKESVIPSSVVGQAFLKTLLEQTSETTDAPKEPVVPSSVVGQAFLKTLLEQTPETTDSPKEPVVPSSVVGQAFLKTLLEQTPETTEAPKEPVVPSSVVGQAFLKTLLEQTSETTDASKDPVIPSSVVGQAFLKTLLEQTPETTEVPKEPVVPSSVVGQAFLKTLLEQTPETTEVPKEPVVPSSVVSQAFLKTLLEKTPEPTESIIPSSVVGQTFLKTLIEQTPEIQNVPKPVIPSSVVEQTFLKTLSGQMTQSEKELKETVVPSSVVGLSFLKFLTEQAKSDTSCTSGEAKSFDKQAEEKSIPASVIGQAFLKTLYSMSDQSTSKSEDLPADLQSSEQQICKGDDKELECKNGHGCSSELSFLDEQSAIIPPPPEFSGESDAQLSSVSSSSKSTDASKKELPSNLIQELLSCTEVMESVIESMKDAGTQKETTDICSLQVDNTKGKP